MPSRSVPPRPSFSLATQFECRSSILFWFFIPRQVSCIVRELLSLADAEASSSHLLCGTFNMEEGCPGYQLIADGYLSDDMIETLQKQTLVQIPNKNVSTSSSFPLATFSGDSLIFSDHSDVDFVAECGVGEPVVEKLPAFVVPFQKLLRDCPRKFRFVIMIYIQTS